jgi:drug/metabolite transporter (DMT)-like permease
MKLSKAAPSRLIGFSILGSLIAVSAFLLLPIAIHFRDHGHGGSLGGIIIANLIGMLAFFGGGWYLSFWSQLELSNGIASDRWTEEQLRPVRAFSESRILAKVAPIALLVLGIVLYLIEASDRHHSSSIGFWVCFVLSNGLIALNRSLAPPSDSQSAPWLETSAPLRSEHWGE